MADKMGKTDTTKQSAKSDVKAANEPLQPALKAESGPKTGDKGNPHYAKELDALAKDKGAKNEPPVMKSTSACGLGMAAPHVTESLLRYFPDQVKAHLADR